MKSSQQFWLGKLANLNVARTDARGIAPHKPLMLLTVMDLIENGEAIEGWVKFDVRLVSRFRDYWELVRERQRNQRSPRCQSLFCRRRSRLESGLSQNHRQSSRRRPRARWR
ncbi:MAG: hypothetical protein LAT58_08740 [Opitutales bacterium]|nr:hypothetical protein [Opitutales bacterium]